MLSLLSGVRVLDISRLIPGAYATSKLADLGADVIKIEQPPNGDYIRIIPPLFEGLSLLHIALNRNKRSIVVGLDTHEGRDTFRRLVGTADIFVEGSRPGAMKLIGADYDSLRAIKPDIIYCSVSGYGQTGPYADLPSHGANLEGAAGLVNIEPRPDGTSEVPNLRVFMASQSGGVHAALAIVAALHKRQMTGEGSYLDVGCWDGAISWHYGNLTCLANTGELLPGSSGVGPKYGCYQASDGGWVFVALVEPKFWVKFCKAVDRPDLAKRVNAAVPADRGENDPRLIQDIADLIKTRPVDEWVQIAVREQLPLAPVLRPRDLLTNEHARVRESFVSSPHSETGSEVKVLNIPIKVQDEKFEVVRPAPKYGEHTEEIRAELKQASGVEE
jgi:crotonobetainyl-CoA:carnitine CoA-transferase CaiB-like acyl-CoA transferase